MKKLLLTIITTMSLIGCGGDSGQKAVTTTDNGGGTHTGGTYTPQPPNCTGSSCHNGSAFTPSSVGENQFPGGIIELAYAIDSVGAVDANGRLSLDTDYGFSDCLIAAGQYTIDTINYGVIGSIAHNYRNITIEARRSNMRFSGVIENAVAMENTQGLWVQSINKLNITSVNGVSCNYLSLSFAMPLMN